MTAHYFVISWLTALREQSLAGDNESYYKEAATVTGVAVWGTNKAVPSRRHPAPPLGCASAHLTLQNLAEIHKWQYYIEWLMTICRRFYCCSYWIRPLLLGVPVLAQDMGVGTDLLRKSSGDDYSSLSSCTQWEFCTKNLDSSTPRFISIKVPARQLRNHKEMEILN